MRARSDHPELILARGVHTETRYHRGAGLGVPTGLRRFGSKLRGCQGNGVGYAWLYGRCDRALQG